MYRPIEGMSGTVGGSNDSLGGRGCRNGFAGEGNSARWCGSCDDGGDSVPNDGRPEKWCVSVCGVPMWMCVYLDVAVNHAAEYRSISQYSTKNKDEMQQTEDAVVFSSSGNEKLLLCSSFRGRCQYLRQAAAGWNGNRQMLKAWGSFECGRSQRQPDGGWGDVDVPLGG